MNTPIMTPIVNNCGFFFGLFSSSQIFLFINILVFFAFVVIGVKHLFSSGLGILGFILVIGGGGINLYYRLVNGCVADSFRFLPFGNGGSVFFNVADISIMVGLFICGYILYYSLSKENNLKGSK